MPYLAGQGVCSVAVNLRGTAGALPPANYNEGKKVVSLKDHVQVSCPFHYRAALTISHTCYKWVSNLILRCKPFLANFIKEMYAQQEQQHYIHGNENSTKCADRANADQ